jgi:glycine cleavage system H protein
LDVTVPEQLRYTAEHEWVETRSDGTVRVGITAYAQEQLGDVVFVDLPDVGDAVSAGSVFGEVESTKSVSELYSPVDGEVSAVNSLVVETPEVINSEPYGQGWLVEITPAGEGGLEHLLDSAAYRKLIEA